MKKLSVLSFLALTMVFSGSFPALAEAKSDKPPIIDLIPLLAPPPAQDSEQTKAELQELLNLQKTRTPAQETYAQGDVEKNIFRFSDVMGDKFTEASLPLTAALFTQALDMAKSAVKPIKKFYDRPRPYTADQDVKPCVKEEDTAESYPSGHATAGTVMAVVLANMVPEKKAEIFARGWAFAMNRVIGGVHYRSDIEEGRIAGTLVAAALLKDPKFMKDFTAAKKELRGVLGY